MAILDETDSGLDIDALRIVAEGVNAMLNPDLGVLLITHYQRLLNYIKPDVVHVLAQGRIVKTGGKDLALRLEDEGYGPILREAGLSVDAPDEALLVPKGPELEPVEVGRLGRRSPPMAIETRDATVDAASLDPVALRRDFPILDQRDQRPPAGLPRLGVDAARSRTSSSTRVDDYYREYNANVHRGIYTIGEKATAAYEEARVRGRAVHQRPGQPRDRLHAQRDRGDQPRRLLVGPAQHRAAATRSS